MDVFNSSIVIPYGKVLAGLKFNKSLTNLDAKTEGLIKNALEKSYDFIEPQGNYTDFLVTEISEKKVFLEGFPEPIVSSSIAELLKKSGKATLFVVTIGGQLLKEVEKLSLSGKMAEAVIFDVIGSVAVEEIAESLNALIQVKASLEGYRLTRRFSPGYGDFELKEQKNILKVLKADRLGISLTESLLMLPEKSVTAIMGWEK